MPGVIFLDFDGPIFPTKVFLMPENNEPASKETCEKLNLHTYVNYWKADPISIAMLNKLYEIYPYELVISSSWAEDWLHEKEQIEGLLNINGLEYNIHQQWRTPRDKYDTRHEQIAHWLNENPQYREKYIIIDDVSSGSGLAEKTEISRLGLKEKNIFLVNVDEGMTYRNYKEISSIIRNW